MVPMKSQPHLKQLLVIGSLVTAIFLYPHITLALSSDTHKIAKFVADHVAFNYRNGTTVYTGHVTMDQGTTHLQANKVTIYRDPNGNINQVIATGTAGNLAHYTTLPDKQRQSIEAYGDTIEYYPAKQLAIIIGDGKVVQGKNSLQGSHIVYDLAKQTVVSSPSHPGNKSVIVLQPNELPGK